MPGANTIVPERVVLLSVRWSWFASFTVRERSVPDVRIRKIFMAWLRRLEKRTGYHLLPWCLRIESGRDIVHRHCHVLVGRLGRKDCENLRRASMDDWEQIVSRGRVSEIPFATARIRSFISSSGADGYLVDNCNSTEVQGWEQAARNGFLRLSRKAWAAAWETLHRAPVLKTDA